MQITVNGQLLTVTDDALVSNSVGIYECEFTFDSSWDGFSKTSVWKLNSDDPIEVVISNGKATIPHEVLVNAGFLRIGVYGTKDEKVMPTVWLETRKVCLGTPTGSIGTQPTPSIYAQILAVATNAENVANGVKTEWESVSATAETLEPTEGASVVFEDNTFKFGIPQGESGGDGFSPIVTVTPITNGHRVTITDAEGVHTFDVLDGTDGADGVGITNIVMNADYTLTITLSNGTSFTTPSIRGEQGEKGEDGNGIVSITKTATVGKVDTYTITYTDGTTSTFDVTNGQDGITDFASYLPIDSANGTIASFTDGAEDIPVEDLKVYLEPIQDLNGQSSPYPAGGGKNLWNDAETTVGNFERNGTTYTNTATDTRTYGVMLVQTFNGTTLLSTSPSISASSVGRYSITITIADTITHIRLKHSGATRDMRIDLPFTQTGTFTVSFTMAGVNPQTVGGFIVKDIQLESGSTATAYAPYENICPISGRNSVELVRCGVNVWDEEWELGQFNNATGQPISATDCIRSKNFIPVQPSTSYYTTYGGGYMQVFFYKEDETFISHSWVGASNVITTQSECKKMKFRNASAYGTTYNNDISINYPSTDHDYHPYTADTYPISLGQTVYGGVLDVTSGKVKPNAISGTLNGNVITASWFSADASRDSIGFYLANKTWTEVTGLPAPASGGGIFSYCATHSVYNNDLPWIANILFVNGVYNRFEIRIPKSSLADVSTADAALNSAKAYLNEHPLQIVYEVASTETQLTPTEVTTLLGDNNLFVTDENGTVEVTYRADIQRYVDKKISALATL